MADSGTIDDHYYQAARPNTLAERRMIRARDDAYATFIKMMAPAPDDPILDIGVSDVVGDGANALERLYPFPDRITAAGLGEGTDFRAAFPPVTYRQIEANRPLPFADGQFAIATSNAVLEHVGSTENQRALLAEMCRVARRVFVTVPNRLFPVEHHTSIPFLHYTGPSFALACRLIGRSEWTLPENLILMSRGRLARLVPSGMNATTGHCGLRLGPFSSNLFLSLAPAGARVAA